MNKAIAVYIVFSFAPNGRSGLLITGKILVIGSALDRKLKPILNFFYKLITVHDLFKVRFLNFFIKNNHCSFFI
jgi:hypothetical protein